MAPITVFDADKWNGTLLRVNMVSNSTVSNFQLDKEKKTISFNLADGNDPVFCRITVPHLIIQDLWGGNYTVLVDGQPAGSRSWTDTDNTYMYFTYPHSENKVQIIPEFPSFFDHFHIHNHRATSSNTLQKRIPNVTFCSWDV